MNSCIVCLKEHKKETVEHIVPRSLGNIHYILKKGTLCSNCNNRFAKYEHIVLNCPSWLDRRKKYLLVRDRNLDPGREPDQYEMGFFLLKIFYEGMFQSQKKSFETLPFEPIRLFLTGEMNLSFEILEGKRLFRINPIPSWIDRWRLKRNHIEFGYYIDEERWWFQFRFSDIYTIVAMELTE